jgi:hypothetical protein
MRFAQSAQRPRLTALEPLKARTAVDARLTSTRLRHRRCEPTRAMAGLAGPTKSTGAHVDYAIIGGGPSGLLTAKALLKAAPNASVQAGATPALRTPRSAATSLPHWPLLLLLAPGLAPSTRSRTSAANRPPPARTHDQHRCTRRRAATGPRARGCCSSSTAGGRCTPWTTPWRTGETNLGPLSHVCNSKPGLEGFMILLRKLLAPAHLPITLPSAGCSRMSTHRHRATHGVMAPIPPTPPTPPPTPPQAALPGFPVRLRLRVRRGRQPDEAAVHSEHGLEPRRERAGVRGRVAGLGGWLDGWLAAGRLRC